MNSVCSYSYILVGASSTYPVVSTSTCVSVGSSTSPLIVQDAGNLTLAAGIMLVVLFVTFISYIYKNLFKRRKWH